MRAEGKGLHEIGQTKNSNIMFQGLKHSMNLSEYGKMLDQTKFSYNLQHINYQEHTNVIIQGLP